MKISDMTTMRELEDGLEREGFTQLKMRHAGSLTVGNVRVLRYEAILFKGEEWIDALGGSVAEAISECLNKWSDIERKSGE